MSLQIGQLAPDFTLFNSEKQEITLSNFKGNPVLIVFFPLAFSSVCTRELCSIRDNIAIYNRLKVQVLAISVDSIYTLARFKEDQKLSFNLLSDFNKNVSIAYETLYESFGYKMKGVSKRSAFVIDKEGKIVYAEVLENAGELPDFEAIQKVLSTF